MACVGAPIAADLGWTWVHHVMQLYPDQLSQNHQFPATSEIKVEFRNFKIIDRYPAYPLLPLIALANLAS